MTLRPVLVAIPSPDSTGAAGATGASTGSPDEPQALACAESQKSGVPRRLKPAAQLRSPQRVIEQQAYSRVALRECARLCGAPLDGWEKGPDEVPLPHEGYFWSVSHKRTWAAAVIGESPVGIDIEQVTPRHEGVFDALACESEWTLIGDRSWYSFFRLWTAKEATLKANGVGIAGFSACRLLGIPDRDHMTLHYEHRVWSIEHYYLADHIAAVTCGNTPAAGDCTQSRDRTQSRDCKGAVLARNLSPVSWCVLDR